MKCQNLFSGKNKIIIINLSVKLAKIVVNIKSDSVFQNSAKNQSFFFSFTETKSWIQKSQKLL